MNLQQIKAARNENYRRLVNMKNRIKKLEHGDIINGYKILKIKVFGKPAYMVKRPDKNDYRVYGKNNIFQLSQDVLLKCVRTFGGHKI